MADEPLDGRSVVTALQFLKTWDTSAGWIAELETHWGDDFRCAGATRNKAIAALLHAIADAVDPPTEESV